MRVEVDPRRVRFTQDSISNHFGEPHETTSIDDAVTNINSSEWCANDFPTIRIIEHAGVLWSLDNRRLWVFREAGLNSIMVNINKKFASHLRFQELVRNPSMMQTYNSDTFTPRVRRKNIKSKPQTPGYSRFSTRPTSAPVSKLAITPDSRLLKHSQSTSAAVERGRAVGRTQIPNPQTCYGSRSSDEIVFGQNIYLTQSNSESSLRDPLLSKSAGSNYTSSTSSVRAQQPSVRPTPPSCRPGRESRDYSSPPTLSKRNNIEMKEALDGQAPKRNDFLSLLLSWCCMSCVD